MKIVTSEQMRRIEERSEEIGVSTDTLMENAGLGVAEQIRHHLSCTTDISVLMLVGPGNNGGDGLVVARRLHLWGIRTLVYPCTDRSSYDLKLNATRNVGVSVIRTSNDGGLEQLREALSSADVVVDSMLGTGGSRPINGRLKEICQELSVARSGRPNLRIVAIDLPSGLDANTGAVDPVCPPADLTVTLGNPKTGLFQLPGAEYAGRIETVDIGVPDGLDDEISLELMTPEWAQDILPRRQMSAHKGTFGRTLVVAGSRNYVGAAYLAGAAAARSGAGLVTLAIPKSIQSAVAAKAIELTYLPLPESSQGIVSPEAAKLILDNLSEYDSFLIGCGLGQAPSTLQMLQQILYSCTPLPPTVVDADGLNFLARSQEQGWWERFSSLAIVTPHPGEMGRLTGNSADEIQRDRTGTAIETAAKWNKVTVLKGAYTVVAFPEGRAMISPFANPGLASAGTGDVLAGVITGLLSQGMIPEDAAALGVYIHGLAGDLVRDDLGDTGMLASDVLKTLPLGIKKLKDGGQGSRI